MVTGAYQRIQGQEISTYSALSDDDILRRQLHALGAAVGSDALAKSLRSWDRAIRELDARVDGVLGGAAGHGDQVVDGDGGGACLGNVEDARSGLVGVHPLLHGEGGDANHDECLDDTCMYVLVCVCLFGLLVELKALEGMFKYPILSLDWILVYALDVMDVKIEQSPDV